MYTWSVAVERALLQGAEDMTYEDPVTEKAKIKIRNEVVVDAEGREVHTIGTVTLPYTTRNIPSESKLTLPVQFSGQPEPRVVLVAAESRHDTNIPGMPRFYRVYLKHR